MIRFGPLPDQTRIRRNKRYTGDGGVDGRFWIDGQPFFIQAKRYNGAVYGYHVSDFASVCASQGVRGLFVHTGKTPPWTRRIAREQTHIEIVSGDPMLALMTGQPLEVFGRTI